MTEISNTSETTESDSAAEESILREALARMETAKEAETEIRRLALEDLEFRAGDQWPDNVKQDRNRDGRPCLVINRIPQQVNQVTNDQRQNRPSIKVHPVGDGADVETAKVIQGLIRHIEYNSHADVAYDTAFESAVEGGFGYLRVITDFVSPDSFDQEILIKRIRNPHSVFFDPYAQEADGSDANYAFITDDMSPDEYRIKFPNSKLATSVEGFDAIGNDRPDWIKSDSIRVAEYFSREFEDHRIHLLSTGETVKDNELAPRLAAAQASNIQVRVLKSRVAKIPVIKWRKINGIEILESTDWIGSFIPIIPVYGRELWVRGKRILEGMIRNAKDPQRMYNYWASAETEAIALAPKSPFIVAEGQLEGYENDWKMANRQNNAFLMYKPTSTAGKDVPPPQRQNIEPAVQAITNARLVAADDLKATTGVYDAALGAQSVDSSGVAIQRRSHQTQTSNFHYFDNFTRSLRHLGRILVECLPKVYDTARTARIIGDDGDQKMVKINQEFQDESGKKVIYSLETGRYDVMIDSGPSFTSKRQEAAASMQEIVRGNPQLMSSIGDLMVKNMDWPGAQDMADRLKKLLDPRLQDAPNMKDIPPQVQAQMAQMAQMIKTLSDKLNQTTKVIETKKLDIESNERIAIMKTQAEIEMKLAELGSKSNTALLEQEVAVLRHESQRMDERLQLLNVDEPVDAPNSFNPQGANGGNYAGVGHIGSGPTGGVPPGSPMDNQP